MIKLITIVETIEQAGQLLAAGAGTLYFDEEQLGLRLSASFTREEQRQSIELTRRYSKRTNIVVNGIIHPEKMKNVSEYLAFLKEINVGVITVDDTNVIYTVKKSPELRIPYIYDSETLATSACQINLWTKKDAAGAILAREVPFEEMKTMEEKLDIPVEALVYGATCTHQSKRPLLQNYYNYTRQDEQEDRERGLFISEPKKEEIHYSIYEDSHGAYIFTSSDLSLSNELSELYQHHYCTWRLDELFTPDGKFANITRLFAETKKQILEGSWDQGKAEKMTNKVSRLHPESHELDTGFFYIDPSTIR